MPTPALNASASQLSKPSGLARKVCRDGAQGLLVISRQGTAAILPRAEASATHLQRLYGRVFGGRPTDDAQAVFPIPGDSSKAGAFGQARACFQPRRLIIPSIESVDDFAEVSVGRAGDGSPDLLWVDTLSPILQAWFWSNREIRICGYPPVAARIAKAISRQFRISCSEDEAIDSSISLSAVWQISTRHKLKAAVR